MRRYMGEPEFSSVLFHNMPDDSFRYAVTPAFACPTDASEQSSGRNCGCCHPQVDGRFDPVGHRHGSNVAALAHQINYGPVFCALRQMHEVRISQFAATESAAQQNGEDRTVPHSFERVRGRRLPEAAGFLGRKPVPEPHTQLLGTFHTSNASGELRTEQASVCSLVGEPPNRSKSSINRSRCEMPVFEEDTITGNDNLVEGESWLGAIPLNKFINGVSIAALGLE